MPSPGRCPTHDVAPSPSGECLLCRRAALDASARAAPGEGSVLGRLLAIGIALVAVGVVTSVAMRELRAGRRPAVDPTIRPLSLDLPASPPAAAPPPPSAPPPSEPATPVRSARGRSERSRGASGEGSEARVAQLEPGTRPADPGGGVVPLDAPVQPPRPVRIESGSGRARAPETPPSGGREADVAAMSRRISITMYGTSWCGACRAARGWMSAHGVSYVEHDVDHDLRARRRMLQLNPRGSVPTIEVEGQAMAGFSSSWLVRAIERAAAP